MNNHSVSPFILIPLALLAVIAFYGCGSHGAGGMNAVVTSVSEDALNNGFVRIRWFPVENAAGYVLYTEQNDGATLERQVVEPTGCTHLATEGFTSGICSYDIKPVRNARGAAMRLSAFNSEGESARSFDRVNP